MPDSWTETESTDDVQIFHERMIIHGYKNIEDLRGQCFELRRALIYSWLQKFTKPSDKFNQTDVINVLCFNAGESDEESKDKVFVELENANKVQSLIRRFRKQKFKEEGNSDIEKPVDQANIIRMFGTPKDHRQWHELIDKDEAQRIKENAASRKRSTRAGKSTARENMEDDKTQYVARKNAKFSKKRFSQQNL